MNEEKPEEKLEEKLVALPEADLPEPAHPLVAGAFLGGEYEVKELVSRGLTNFYFAQGGDYSSPALKLIAERQVRKNDAPAEPAEMVEPREQKLQSNLFPPAKYFAGQEREYLAFDWSDTTALQDHREAANDVRYLETIGALAAGMLALKNAGLSADFTQETLRFDTDGALKYFGFVDDAPSQEEPLAPLRELNSLLLRQTFGEAGTIRLDDQWSALAMSEEVKEFSRRLEQDYASLEETVEALKKLAPQSTLSADSALQTDIGQVRDINEDSALIARYARVAEGTGFDIELYAVSDGMGGHEGGEVASELSLTALQKLIAESYHLDWQDNVQVRAMLRTAIEEVNAKVLALTEEPKYRASRAKPGATLLFALRVGARVFFGNVGDSRAYRWNPSSGLQRITKDHSYVQTLIDSGEISEEEAFDHPDGSIITAHIGMRKLRQIDLFAHLLSAGDRLLLVSDGVTDMLRENEIETLLQQEEDPRALCQSLVDAANDAGGYDNITAIYVALSES